MNTTFFISNVAGETVDQYIEKSLEFFPEGMPQFVKELIDNPSKSYKQSILAYINGISTSGVSVRRENDGDVTVYISHFASMGDCMLAWSIIMEMVDKNEDAVIYYGNVDGKKSNHIVMPEQETFVDEYLMRCRWLDDLVMDKVENLDEDDCINFPIFGGEAELYVSRVKEAMEKNPQTNLSQMAYECMLDYNWNDGKNNVSIMIGFDDEK